MSQSQEHPHGAGGDPGLDNRERRDPASSGYRAHGSHRGTHTASTPRPTSPSRGDISLCPAGRATGSCPLSLVPARPRGAWPVRPPRQLCAHPSTTPQPPGEGGSRRGGNEEPERGGQRQHGLSTWGTASLLGIPPRGVRKQDWGPPAQGRAHPAMEGEKKRRGGGGSRPSHLQPPARRRWRGRGRGRGSAEAAKQSKERGRAAAGGGGGGGVGRRMGRKKRREQPSTPRLPPPLLPPRPRSHPALCPKAGRRTQLGCRAVPRFPGRSLRAAPPSPGICESNPCRN